MVFTDGNLEMFIIKVCDPRTKPGTFQVLSRNAVHSSLSFGGNILLIYKSVM
jgi:hypothetical protein